MPRALQLIRRGFPLAVILSLTAALTTASAGDGSATGKRPEQNPGVPSLQRVFGERPHGTVSPNSRWGEPSGVWAHRPARGWLILVHGGAWYIVGKKTMLTGTAGSYNAKGWGTYTIDYRPGIDSLWDTIAAYDYMRRRLGPAAPVCAYGQSAGGQLAMLLAAVRPSLDCVISEAGPTDLSSMAFQPAFTSPGQPPSTTVPYRLTVYGTVPAFGATGLWAFSPVRFASQFRLPMLLAGSDQDPIVPEPGQLSEMRHADPGAKVMLLAGAPTPPGQPANFTHASVTVQALASYQRAQAQTLLAGIAHAHARTTQDQSHH